MSLDLNRMKKHVDEGMEYIEQHGLLESHLKQVRMSAIFGNSWEWRADSIQSKVRGTTQGSKKHIKELDDKIGFETLLVPDIGERLFVDFKSIICSIYDTIVKIKDGWTRTTKVISLLIGMLFFIKENKSKIIKLSSEDEYNEIENLIVNLFYLEKLKSNGRIFGFKYDSSKYDVIDQLDNVFVSILDGNTTYSEFKELGKYKNQVFYFKQQVVEYYNWINRNKKLVLNDMVITNVTNFVTNIIEVHIIVLQESLETEDTLGGQDYVETNDYAQEFLADGKLELYYINHMKKNPVLDDTEIKDVFNGYVSDLEFQLQTAEIETTSNKFYSWLQYSNLSNKVTDKRNEKDAFTKLVSDFTIEVKRCGNVNHKDFITRLENNLEENLNYMDDFENIKEFRLSEEGLHDVFIPFILRIKKLGKWDNYHERLFRMFSLLNKVVARGNLWNSFSNRQIDIVKDKDFDTNPAEVLIKHLIEGIDMSNALVQATHKDVVSPDGTLKHQTIFDEFINELLKGQISKAIELLDTVNLRKSKLPSENGEHCSSQNPVSNKPIRNVNSSNNIGYCDEKLNKQLGNKTISEKKKFIENNNRFDGYSLKFLLPFYGWDKVKTLGYDKKNHSLMKKYFNSNFKLIDTDIEWDDYIEEYNPNKKMYGEYYKEVFATKNFTKLMKTGL
jgi:hypothetical protein